MKNKNLIRVLILAFTILIAIGMGWAGGQQSVQFHQWSLFATCGVIIFAIQWLAFIPAYCFKTERFYDLVGSLTYISVIVMALLLADNNQPLALLIGTLVVIWALRLGSFLFMRIHRQGADQRFDIIKHNFLRFLIAWTLQGLWVYLTCSAALVIITSAHPATFTPVVIAGLGLWILGFAIEVIADRQKRIFKNQASNNGFINTGLWKYSRHPNYFGEILLWLGIALMALPNLHGWQFVSLISPIFVYVLLVYISGIPILEATAEKRWGEDGEYQDYKSRTPILVFKLFRG